MTVPVANAVQAQATRATVGVQQDDRRRRIEDTTVQINFLTHMHCIISIKALQAPLYTVHLHRNMLTFLV